MSLGRSVRLQFGKPHNAFASLGVIVFGLGLFLQLGCAGGFPAKVTRVDSPETTRVQGIRYVLKGPSYAVYLQFKADLELDPQLELAVEQKLDREQVYEIQTDSYTFAETEISITVEKDGVLSAFTAGETDKLLETIATVATLAITAAIPKGFTTENVKPESLDVFGISGAVPDEVWKYITKHLELLKLHERLKKDIADLNAGFGTAEKPVDLKNRLEAISAVETEFNRLEEKIKSHRLKIPEGKVVVMVGPKTVLGEGAKDPWVKVQLTRVR